MSTLVSKIFTKSSKSPQLNKKHAPSRVNEINSGGPRLPVELLGLIPYHLDRKELLACCAATRALRTFSRAHLFRTVVVANTSSPPSFDHTACLIQTEELGEVLSTIPDIGSMICSLILFHSPATHASHWISNPYAFDAISFSAFLSRCSCIETFSISRPFISTMGSTGNRWEWADFDVELQSAIEHIVNLPTLKDLRIHEHIIFDSPQDFFDIFAGENRNSLVTLELADVFFISTRHPAQATGPRAILETLKLGYIDGSFTPSLLLSNDSPFKLSRLRSLELNGLGPMDDEWIKLLLDAQESPSTLIHLALLDIEGYPQDAGFLRSLERFTSIRTLHLSEDRDPLQKSYIRPSNLDCLPFWLYTLPTRNTIEELVVHQTDLQYDSSTIASLDGIVTDKDIMPRLKRLVLKITMSDEWYGPVIEKEFETRLSAAKSKDMVEIEYIQGTALD